MANANRTHRDRERMKAYTELQKQREATETPAERERRLAQELKIAERTARRAREAYEAHQAHVVRLALAEAHEQSGSALHNENKYRARVTKAASDSLLDKLGKREISPELAQAISKASAKFFADLDAAPTNGGKMARPTEPADNTLVSIRVSSDDPGALAAVLRCLEGALGKPAASNGPYPDRRGQGQRLV